jgi:hypothetical protein
MITREHLNTNEKYQEIIDRQKKIISERLDGIKDLELNEEKGIQLYPKSNKEVIKNYYDSILDYQLGNFRAAFSMGKSVNDLRDEVEPMMFSIEKCWDKDYDYIQLVWVLSIGIMLEIDGSEFYKIIEVVQNDNPKDYLIDFLINYKVSSWVIKSNKFTYKRPYSAIQEIISLSKIDKEKGLERLKKYLSKEWYRGHSDIGWYDDHKSTGNLHKGYWSFESGALVKILGLDDSSLKETQYYPYDMVHWKD